jgi:hypothetical protein
VVMTSAATVAPDRPAEGWRADHRTLATILCFAVVVPIAVPLFGRAAARLGVLGLSGSGLLVLAAVTLDTLRHVRVHAALARDLRVDPPGDERAASAGVALVEGWVVAAVTEAPLEAEALRLRLAAAGVEGRVLAGTCAPLLGSLGIYDLTPVIPLLPHGSCGGGAVRLLVRPGDHGRAVEALAPSA